jgi:acetyl-CoA carboxylase biotin carboxyl carrier protein
MAEPPDRETQTLRDLLDLMHEHDLDRIKVRLGDAIYELVRREGGVVAAPLPAAAGPAASGEPAAPAVSSHVKRVVAPLTGVFYRSASPDSEVFAELGDRVEKGAVVCILEAMKLFNEIQSDHAGTIVRILPQNGELVSVGEDLFWIEP